MGKRKEKQPEPLYTENVCAGRVCGECAHLTNVSPDQRKDPNVMGGCFISGIIVYTGLESCNEFEQFENETDN